ncbi:STY4534 family ICE replication protein [Salinicola sp. JS01]|uniref:STY4534 family ICE replication protein n=1 Tax=Salinicola sp. JS01 TaxID=3050071 RepID=UPI00255B5AAD|nr:STY4534 family ICE replication protein [Salinicola sp. JS01]WIX33227.1 STY4534 family ICE replication protein [Salinicola sp. JS01]
MSNSTDNQFFDLHVTGVGYVNRIRKVTPKRGNPFWACDISALNGPADDVEYRRFDCRVSGAEAEKLVKKFAATVADRQEKGANEPKILVGFKLGDLYPDLFTRTKGERAGETAVSLKARLLFINWAKVDGDKVYEAPRRDETPSIDTSARDGGTASQETDVPARPAVSGSVGAAEAVV